MRRVIHLVIRRVIPDIFCLTWHVCYENVAENMTYNMFETKRGITITLRSLALVSRLPVGLSEPTSTTYDSRGVRGGLVVEAQQRRCHARVLRLRLLRHTKRHPRRCCNLCLKHSVLVQNLIILFAFSISDLLYC